MFEITQDIQGSLESRVFASITHRPPRPLRQKIESDLLKYYKFYIPAPLFFIFHAQNDAFFFLQEILLQYFAEESMETDKFFYLKESGYLIIMCRVVIVMIMREVMILRKIVAFLGCSMAVLASSPVTALAAQGAAGTSKTISPWFCIPFAGLLFCIAVLPLIKPEWWESHQPLAVAFWSLLFILPFGFVFGAETAAENVLECLVNDYLTFIVLLFGLFCVAGNITMEGDLAGSPRVNIILLAIGTLLSSFIGTTGASMLMVRPVIKMNAWRRHRSHIMVFFIFLISNLGGSLTPIGDPPLLMGFSRGVPFFWSLHLFPIMLFNMAVLLFIFYWVDRKAYCRDIARGRKPDISRPGTKIKIRGIHNLIFLVMIVAAVILSGVLPDMPLFKTAEGHVRGIPVFGEVVLGFPSVIEILIILAAAFLSFKTTSPNIRKKNHFTWGAIKEVAVLFIGIFITMQPALAILKGMGSQLGLTENYQMFWVTGLLSSFLDNTPTYLVFLTTAGAIGFTSGLATTLGTVPAKMLTAISCGAVFMGANTYIGNAPNFMVKAISDENGIHMPSFFGYIRWSLTVLIPVFLLDTLLFFR